MARLKRVTILVLIIALSLSLTLIERSVDWLPVRAQAPTCPEIVRAALEVTSKQCVRIGRNKVCYGNVQIKVEPQPSVKDLKFASPGDIADVKNIKSLTLSGLDTSSGVWGVTLMRIQADLPDTSPEDNVTLVLFGDVQISDTGPEADIARATSLAATQTANAPTPASAQATRTAVAGATATIKALTPSPTRPGPTTTPKPAPPVKPFYKPMQAFIFKSGEVPTCQEAPSDGILVQTPKGKGTIRFSVDGVILDIGSTIFMQAQPGKYLIITTLEGLATATAAGRVYVAPVGTRIFIPLDANLLASGPPNPPVPLDPAVVQALPIQLLPLQVSIPAPAVRVTSGSIAAAGVGEACFSGGMSVSVLNTVLATSAPGVGTRITTLPVGYVRGKQPYILWSATAGTTGTFSVSDGTRDPDARLPDRIALGTGSDPYGTAFAKSGNSTSLTYTFTKDTQFTIGVPTKGGQTVTLSINCAGSAVSPTAAGPTPTP